MIKLAVMNRAAGVIGALAVCLAVTGCIGREEFDKVTKGLQTSLDANKAAAAEEQASLRASLEKAAAKQASDAQEIKAIQTEMVELRKVLKLAAQIDAVQENVDKQISTLEQFQKDLTDSNVKVAAMSKKLGDVATRDSVVALRTDMTLRVTGLEAKDAELAKTGDDKDAKQDTIINGLVAVSDEAVKDLGEQKMFITKLDAAMQDHKEWTLKAVGLQDSTMIDHSKNLRGTLQATVQALEAQLAKIKAIADAIKVHQATSAPVSK